MMVPTKGTYEKKKVQGEMMMWKNRVSTRSVFDIRMAIIVVVRKGVDIGAEAATRAKHNE